MDIFVKLPNQTGPVTTPASRGGWFRCTSFGWPGINAEGSAANRRHFPLTIVRTVDGGSAPLLDTLARSQPVGTVQVGIDVPDPKGGVKSVATYELRNATVLRIAYRALNGGADAVTEEIELAYDQILVQHDPTFTKFSDAKPSNP